MLTFSNEPLEVCSEGRCPAGGWLRTARGRWPLGPRENTWEPGQGLVKEEKGSNKKAHPRLHSSHMSLEISQTAVFMPTTADAQFPGLPSCGMDLMGAFGCVLLPLFCLNSTPGQV